MELKKSNFHFFCLAATGSGISGGDRIFIEFARRWQKQLPVKIYTSAEGEQMCQRQQLEGPEIKVVVGDGRNYPFALNYLYKIVRGFVLGFQIRLQKDDLLYSASDFWMDLFPALILKWRYPANIWVAGWYQTAPNPLKGYSLGNRQSKYRLNALVYWLMQLLTRPLVNAFADFVCINNEQERVQFPRMDQQKKTIVVLGAVDVTKINQWRAEHPKLQKKYSAVFQGRLHAQKGVVEMMEIWKLVTKKKSSAKLAVIGDGPLMSEVKAKIKQLSIAKNVTLLGYQFDGDVKYQTFGQSQIVLHPAFYDSGGMAAAEAMAFGLPVVGFDLPAYKSYYPQGMIKVPIGDLPAFADAIVKLLDNKTEYQKYATQAESMINKNWSWDYRAWQVLKNVL